MSGASEDRFPVSYAQQRLWFLDRLSPGSALYVIPVTLRLMVEVDVAMLARTVNEIVRRHEILRTTFLVENGELLQVIGSSLTIELPVIDLQRVPGEDREGVAREHAAAEVRRPFDLTTGPLLRATLYRIGPVDHLLLLAFHHIVADGWSVGLLFGELRMIYPAFVQGKPSPLPDLPIQYADYAVWQRQRLGGAVLEVELNYWRQQLVGLPILLLPVRRRSTSASAAVRMGMTLPPMLVAQLTALARREGATLFMVLLAGFQALLYRYSRQGDFAVGTTVANRSRAEVETLIGCFVNTLVIRADVRRDDTFRDLIRKVRETTISAYAHQEMPFERLVEELRPARDRDRTPLVQTLFSLQNMPSVAQNPADQLRAGWELDRGSANFDLTVDFWETPEGLESRWEYRPELFTTEMVDQMMRHYSQLLGGLAETPDHPVASLALLGPEERRTQLLRGQGPSISFAATPVHRAIAEVVGRWPSRIAASSHSESLTYGQLQTRADRLARELHDRGLRRGEIVAILVERSLAFGVAVLGVMGAGGAFLLVDPTDPVARRDAMLEAASARLVVTDRTRAAQVHSCSHDVLCLNDLDHTPLHGSQVRATDPRDDARPGELAYVIYTSGSTGVPKGTLIPHGALANHSHAVALRYELGPDDRVLQLARPGFDVILEELLPVWLTGGSVYFPPHEGGLPFADLEQLLVWHRITVLNLTSSYWHEWVDHLLRTGRRVPDSLRLVICGSERAAAGKLRHWQEVSAPHVRWMNAYGVSEATITATTYEPARRVEDNLPDIVPIGRPLANINAYVLEESGEPVPPGVVGELHLGGAGLGLGYLGRPDLTAERFISSTDSSLPDSRIYRTGDLVRFGQDGDLEFVGRRDTQVKVRGYRVELEEVEAALMCHPEIREAAVRESAGRLVACTVPRGAEPLNSSELSAYLLSRLPSHMVPQAFVTVGSLPRSASGKIDRTALPLPEDAAARAERVAPRNACEAQIAELWADVLDVPEVGVTDSFFELGGHSLLAMQLLSRMQAALGVEIPVRTLFETPTVAALSAVVCAAPATPFAPPISRRVEPFAARERLPIDVDQLSDSEVDALLGELIGEEEAQ